MPTTVAADLPDRDTLTMAAEPPQVGAGGGTTFSPDGFWWWDGSQWRSALSPDGAWRWNGSAWLPVSAPRTGGPRASGVLIAAAGFGGVLLLVLLLTLFVLYTMGSQITNVFSNVAAALGSP